MNAGLFLISTAILALEILHMRILTVQMWYHHAYMVVTLAMLGFAVSGTVATVWPAKDDRTARHRIAWCAALFGLTALIGHILLSTMAYTEVTLSSIMILLTPYFFGGMVVTLVLSMKGAVNVLYFVNMIGSAVGTWVFMLLIEPLGGEGLLVFCAALGALSALFFLKGLGKTLAKPFAFTLLAICAVLLWLQPSFLDIIIAPEKKQHLAGEIIDQRWSPLARLDVFAAKPKLEDNSSVHIVQDGGAGSIMFSKEGWTPYSAYDAHAAAYVPALRRHILEGGEAPEVAIIGIGGGADIRFAQQMGAKKILALEISQSMADLAGKDYAHYTGDLFNLEGVEVVIGEGRSTLARRGRDGARWDVIVLAGADTYTAGAYGAFVLSESYLYTNEALDVYLDNLKPGGTIGILRLCDQPPRESLRLFGMALLRLKARGIQQPSQNVALIRDTWAGGMVISNEPLHQKDIDFYKKAGSDPKGRFEAMYYPGMEKSTAYTQLAKAIENGKEDEFFANYIMDIRPTADDSPFFFNFHHIWDLQDEEDSAMARFFKTTAPIAPSILRNLLLQVLLLVGALVIAPLFFLKRHGLGCDHVGRHLIFFLSIGAGFMFLEISTVQRLILFLGHPTYSLTVVLFSFLFFAGLGAVVSSKLFREEIMGLRVLAWTLGVMILVFAVLLEFALPALMHLELRERVLISIALLAPINFVMGMPFPLGLMRLKKEQPTLVPWAIGANGGASVIGSVISVIIAMELGFRYVALAALLVYVLGLLAVTTGPLAKRSSPA